MVGRGLVLPILPTCVVPQIGWQGPRVDFIADRFKIAIGIPAREQRSRRQAMAPAIRCRKGYIPTANFRPSPAIQDQYRADPER